MEIENLFGNIYKDKTCLITGHTGFKGSWLAHWLTRLGANVVGYSLKPATIPNHYELLNPSYTSIYGDVSEIENLRETFSKYEPDIVFHLAAQALVRYSFANPVETYKTNVLGTINVLESALKTKSVKALVNVTSDKCYDNKEWIRGYRENDPMGGDDPYSSSKGCAELVTKAYQNSYFKKEKKLLVSARAGNVIGGGDWAADRIIPDIMRATSVNENVVIRNPHSTRPWQHVLEPLSGYLTLGWQLLAGNHKIAEGWNFGPGVENNISVQALTEKARYYWDKINSSIGTSQDKYKEANLLMLDCSKSFRLLKWKSLWDIEQTLKRTIDWYKSFYTDGRLNTNSDLEDYINSARKESLIWTC